MTSVLLEPGALFDLSARLLRTSARLAATGGEVVMQAGALPPVLRAEALPSALPLAARLERMAGELSVVAARQARVAALAEAADVLRDAVSFLDTRPAAFWKEVVTDGRLALSEALVFTGKVMPIYRKALDATYEVEQRSGVLVARLRVPAGAGELGRLLTGGRLADTWALPGERAAGALSRAITPVNGALSLGPDIWDYSGWGTQRRDGYASTGFASAIITDVAITAAQGAAMGMVEPFGGPVAGFVLGAVLGLGMLVFPPARQFRDTVRGGVQDELDHVVPGARQLTTEGRRALYPTRLLPGSTRPPWLRPWSAAA